MRDIFISFVLPAYNEEKNVLPLLEQITNAMRVISLPYELVFVVEGNDATKDILERYKKSRPRTILRILYQKKPLGLMAAFKRGFENISKKTTHVVTMDVDLNHDPMQLPRLIEKARAGYDVVIGSRAMDQSLVLSVPFWKRVLSWIANTLFVLAFKINVKDKTSGYRMINSKTIREVSPLVRTRNFEGLIEFLLIANKKRKRIAEVPITLTYRKYGTSKIRLLRTAMGYLRLLMRQDLRR